MQSPSPSDVRYYNRSLLNPFRGTLAVVESTDARASSEDGRHWHIEILASPPRDLWAETSPTAPRRYYAFGEWSHEEGLQKVPLSPMLDSHSMIHFAEALLVHLPSLEQRLPFPFREHHELWLLGQGHRCPQYLVATGRKPAGPHPRIDWGLPGTHGHAISRLIRRSLGDAPAMRWFDRETDHSSVLPELPFNLAPNDPVEQRQIDEYIAELAPRLLTLPTLKNDTRARLERLASKQPQAVARLWRLYPRILDKKLLTRTRVAAKIGKANRG